MTIRMRAVVVREYGGKAEIVELPAPEVGNVAAMTDLVNAPAAFNGEGEPVFDGKTVIVV